MIVDKNYDPCIVFTFDKKMIEEQAKALDRLDLNSDTEKSMIDAIFEASIDQLSPEDQNLPQVVALLPILKRGIGFHHSGLLPVLKEVIEILFQEGLIKVLIATETMSTGLNMPCRSVVFTAPRKYDGAEFGYRWISSGEYVQVSVQTVSLTYQTPNYHPITNSPITIQSLTPNHRPITHRCPDEPAVAGWTIAVSWCS